MVNITIQEECENSPKKLFLKDFNIAFARNDIQAIINAMTDDVVWTVIGGKRFEGKEAVAEELKKLEGEQATELVVHTIITHGDTAAANGVMKFATGLMLAFCDIYIFSGHGKNARIKTMTSYGIDITPDK